MGFQRSPLVARPTLARIGKLSTPVEPAIGYYQDGWVTSRVIDSTPFAFVTNGTFDVAPQGTSAIILGHATVPVVPHVEGETGPDAYWSQLVNKDIPERCLWQYDRHDNSTFNTKVPTEAQTPTEGFLLTRNQSFIYLKYDLEWFARFIDDIQVIISKRVRGGGSYPELRMVGYNLMQVDKDKLKMRVANRAVNRFRFGGEHLAEWRLDQETWTKTQLIQHNAYLSLLAAAQKRFILGHSDIDTAKSGLFWPDWKAWASMRLFQFRGAGDIKVDLKWAADDIVDQVAHYIGMGYTQANPWPIITLDDMRLYVEYCVIFGIVASRIQALTQMATLYRERGFFSTAADKLNFYNRAQLPGAGSLNIPYMQWRYNTMLNPNAKGGANAYNFPLFGVVDEVKSDDEAGKFVFNRQRMNEKFQRVEVRNGEVESPYFEPDNPTEVSILPVNHCDVRIRDVTQPYGLRVTRTYEFPIFYRSPDFLTDGKDEEDENRARRLLHDVNSMSNLSTMLKDGYYLSPGMLISMAQGVKYSKSSIDFARLVDGRVEMPGRPQLTREAQAQFQAPRTDELRAGNEMYIGEKLSDAVGSKEDVQHSEADTVGKRPVVRAPGEQKREEKKEGGEQPPST